MKLEELELWQLWKLMYEQSALLSQSQQNISLLSAEIKRRESKELENEKTV